MRDVREQEVIPLTHTGENKYSVFIKPRGVQTESYIIHQTSRLYFSHSTQDSVSAALIWTSFKSSIRSGRSLRWLHLQAAASVQQGALTHHVILLLVESHLAAGKSSQTDVDGCSDDAVISHLIIECVHLLRRVCVLVDVCVWKRHVLNQHSWVSDEENPQHGIQRNSWPG